MNVIEQIENLNEEIAAGAEIEAKLRRFIKREEKGSEQRRIADAQLRLVTLRLDRAERERSNLKAVADKIVRNYPPRGPVTFRSIEVMA